MTWLNSRKQVEKQEPGISDAVDQHDLVKQQETGRKAGTIHISSDLEDKSVAGSSTGGLSVKA
jgi:hypothetical protein